MVKHRALRCALVIVVAVLLPPSLHVFDASPVAAQVTPLDEEPDETPSLGRITGTPDPGPSPENAGDRGGAAQLAVALILFLALVFIGWRIRRESQRGRAQ